MQNVTGKFLGLAVLLSFAMGLYVRDIWPRLETVNGKTTIKAEAPVGHR